MSRLWRNTEATPEGKYPIVLRRDGTVLEGPYFVICYRDPCAAAAFHAYANEAERQGYDPQFVSDVRGMADEAYAEGQLNPGDPERGPHRTDDPKLIAWARSAHDYGQGST